MTVSSFASPPANSATMRPSRTTSTRCAEAEHLLQLARDDSDAEPVGRELVDQLVDRALRADVDPARRLVGKQDLGVFTSHFAIAVFCWLPPERAETGID